MKKMICTALALILIAGSLLTACSEKKENNIDDNLPVINLALREGIYADVIEECLPAFEEKYQVHCNVLKLSEDDLHSLVTNDAQHTDGTYDLCMVDGSWMAEYTNGNVLADLSELGYEFDDDIIPATTEVCYYNGDIYLTPYYGNVTVLLYNKFLIKMAGYDVEDLQSMEDVLAICKKSQQIGNLGFMYRGDSNNNYVVDFLPVLLSFGGWVVDENNNPTVETPEFKKALEFYIELISTGKAESRDNLVMAIANNAATMAVGWPGWYTPAKKSAADYMALSGKETKGSVAYNANVYGIWTLGIPANSSKKDIAVELLKYLMDKDVQKETIPSGGVPCRYSSLRDKEVTEQYPQYTAVCDALENGVYRPIMVEWPEFYTVLGQEMEKMIGGQKTVDEGLHAAQSMLEEIVK
ncbi:MAG: extracellular solute-binding protein [Lachnospiraceae bacterium]|nr:extracellular solute-binding protein [Lachnospiraceae bacterium]